MRDDAPMLFELHGEDTMRKDAIALNRLRIHEAISNGKPWPMSTNQRRVLECVRTRQGRDQAIGIADLERRLELSPREIKSCVRELVVVYRLAIVASRDGETGGYFFATTADERRIYSADYLKEAGKLILRAQIIRNEPDVNVLLGQLALDLKEGESK